MAIRRPGHGSVIELLAKFFEAADAVGMKSVPFPTFVEVNKEGWVRPAAVWILFHPWPLIIDVVNAWMDLNGFFPAAWKFECHCCCSMLVLTTGVAG